MDQDPSPKLARALEQVSALRFPAHVMPEVKAQLESAARSEKGPLHRSIGERRHLGPGVLAVKE